MSQNNTVTCFISPGSVLPASANALFCGPGVASGAPHWPQNRCSGGLLAPQDGHALPKAAPHCPQNFIPAAWPALHRGHLMPGLHGAPECALRMAQPIGNPSKGQGFATLQLGSPQVADWRTRSKWVQEMVNF